MAWRALSRASWRAGCGVRATAVRAMPRAPSVRQPHICLLRHATTQPRPQEPERRQRTQHTAAADGVKGKGDGTLLADVSKGKPGDGSIPPELWRNAGILTASQFAVNLGFGCVIPVLPLFAAQLGLGASGVGMILSAPSVTRLLLNIPFGQATDKYGRKPLMIAGQMITMASSFGTGMSTTLPMLLASRLCLGVGSSASMAGSGAYMADMTDQAPMHKAKIMGFHSTAINLAFAVGPALGGFLCDAYGPQTSFFVVGTCAGICTVGFSFLPETHKAKVVKYEVPVLVPGEKLDKPKAEEAEEHKSLLEVYGPLLRQHNQQGVVMMNLALFTSYSALLVLLPLHGSQVLHMSATDIGLLFAVGSCMGFVGAPLGGYLADKIGRIRTIIPAAGLIAVGCASLTLPGVDNFEAMVGGVAVWGLGNSLMGPGMTAYTADITKGANRGQAMALSRQSADIAFLCAPIGLGFIAELSSCRTALQVSALSIAAATVFVGSRAKDEVWLAQQARR